MVLTDPDWRRRGLASRLMEKLMLEIKIAKREACLDATPAGEAVYRDLGFSGSVKLARWVIPAVKPLNQQPPDSINLQPIAPSQLSEVAAWDAEHTGWNRSALLQFLLQEAPTLAFMARDSAGQLQGLCLGRPGSRINHIGPIVATDCNIAVALAARSLAQSHTTAFVDAFEAQSTFTHFLANWGGKRERPFLRMSQNENDELSQSDNPFTFASAGPELG